MSECRADGLVEATPTINALVATATVNGLVDATAVLGSAALVPSIGGVPAPVSLVAGVSAAVPPVQAQAAQVPAVNALAAAIGAVNGGLEETDISLLIDFIRTLQRGARACWDDPLRVWRVRGRTQEPYVTDDPQGFDILDVYQEVAQGEIQSALWKNGGFIYINATFKMIHPSNNFVPTVKIEVAELYASGPGSAGATRGLAPAAAGSTTPWVTAFEQSMVRVDSTAHTDSFFFEAIIVQGLSVGASAEQTYTIETTHNDPSSLTAEAIPHRYTNFCNINCETDKLIRMSFKKDSADAGYFVMQSSYAQMFCMDQLGAPGA